MKKRNITIILILAILLIIIGIGLGFFMKPFASKEKIKKTAEIRDYKKVTSIENNKLNQLEPTEESYINLVKKIGFENVICEETTNTSKSFTCKGSKKGYTNSNLKDFTAYSYKNNEIESFNVILYFYKEDYTTKNITTTLNIITNNFFGTKITSSQIEEIKNGLESSEENIYIKNYIAGEYTYELNVQPVINEDFFVVKYIVMKTDLYNVYFKKTS